jgi:hypothetical protein
MGICATTTSRWKRSKRSTRQVATCTSPMWQDGEMRFDYRLRLAWCRRATLRLLAMAGGSTRLPTTSPARLAATRNSTSLRCQFDHLGALIQPLQVSDADERRALWRQGWPRSFALRPSSSRCHRGTRSTQFSRRCGGQCAADGRPELAGASRRGSGDYELAAAIPHARSDAPGGRSSASTRATPRRSMPPRSPRSLGALTGGPIRARVALALSPDRKRRPSDARARAAVAPRLCSEWLTEPAADCCPRGAAARSSSVPHGRRASRGRRLGSLRSFQEPSVLSAWQLLLGDRESLVWRQSRARHPRPGRSGARSRDRKPAGPAAIADRVAARGGPARGRHSSAGYGARALSVPAPDHCAAIRLAGMMAFGLTRAAEVEPEAADGSGAALLAGGRRRWSSCDANGSATSGRRAPSMRAAAANGWSRTRRR